jgi:hypothetical protein
MDVQQISDELEIAALLSTYARAVDTKDWALYRSMFTDDADIGYSTGAGTIAGTPEEVADRLSQAFATIPMSMHYITNSVIAAVTTTTTWCVPPTVGAVAAFARTTSGSSTGQSAFSLRQPTDHRRRRFRDRGCRAPCRTLPVHGSA